MKEQVLAVRGVGGYRQYRIPAMAVTPSGKILAIYDARADFDDLPGPIDLVIRTSVDQGSTWSEQEVFRKHTGHSGFGDASITVDPSYGEFGRVIVLYQSTQDAGFFESVLGSEENNPRIAHIGRSISDDDGVTWRHDLITDQLKDEITPGIFATSGMGGRITAGEFAGRLLQTFVLRREFELLAAIGFSDDHGENWQLGALLPGGNESAIVGLRDGSILIHSRATPLRIMARSFDGGKTLTVVEPEIQLPDPSDNGSLGVLSNGDVICTHNHDTDLRMNTLLKKSSDGGKSWDSAICIEPGSSAYSTACELSDGSIGVLYERNAYQEIVFTRYSTDEFLPIEQVVKSKPQELEFTVVPRYIRPVRNLEVEAAMRNTPKVPEVDMSGFRSSERKEVGATGGTTSGDPLFTSDELEKILGPISPGLHLNDEIRFSVRINNLGVEKLQEIELLDRENKVVFAHSVLNPKEKVCALDIRQVITRDDAASKVVTFDFKLNFKASNSNREADMEINQVVTVEIPNGAKQGATSLSNH